MRRGTHLRFLAVGFILLLLGFGAVFAMVIRVVEASFALSFLAYTLSLAGLICGLVGITMYGPVRRD